MLDELLSFARKREEQEHIKAVTDKLFPLWLANYALARWRGGELEMDYQTFLEETLSGRRETDERRETGTKRTADEIWTDFEEIIAADKARRKEG